MDADEKKKPSLIGWLKTYFVNGATPKTVIPTVHACGAAIECADSPPAASNIVRSVTYFPIGGRRFGFLAPYKCDCQGCRCMTRIAKRN